MVTCGSHIGNRPLWKPTAPFASPRNTTSVPRLAAVCTNMEALSWLQDFLWPPSKSVETFRDDCSGPMTFSIPFLYNFMVLLNRPVQSALFFRNGPVPNVCVWFRARSSRFPEVGTHGCHCGNDRLPIARNWRFKHIRSHGSKAGNERLPLQATSNSQRLELMPPNLGTKVTTTRNYQFQDLETYGSQPGNQRLPLQGAAWSERLELLVPNLGTMWVTLASNCRLPGDGTHASKPGNHRLPLQELPVPQGWNWRFATWEQKNCTKARNCRFPGLKLTVPNLGTISYHCKQLPVPSSWN